MRRTGSAAWSREGPRGHLGLCTLFRFEGKGRPVLGDAAASDFSILKPRAEV